jgi:hypothetical protein
MGGGGTSFFFLPRSVLKICLFRTAAAKGPSFKSHIMNEYGTVAE